MKTTARERQYQREWRARNPKKHSAYTKAWAAAHPEQRRGYNRKSYAKHKVSRDAYTKEYQRTVRKEIIGHYGGSCACCGETELAFLAIDHIGGGGAKHRRALGMTGGSRFYAWLRRNKYPEGFRVLCHNCNQATSWARVCPHKLLEV